MVIVPVPTKPEDKPAAVCFHLDFQGDGLQVTCTLLPRQEGHPYRIDGGKPRFAGRNDFKDKVVASGMSPAVAEDPGRSFNATARQLQKLGFSVQVEKDAA